VSVSVYSVFVLSYVGSVLRRFDHPSKIPTDCIYKIKEMK
jgi:hypothetical protein